MTCGCLGSSLNTRRSSETARVRTSSPTAVSVQTAAISRSFETISPACSARQTSTCITFGSRRTMPSGTVMRLSDGSTSWCSPMRKRSCKGTLLCKGSRGDHSTAIVRAPQWQPDSIRKSAIGRSSSIQCLVVLVLRLPDKLLVHVERRFGRIQTGDAVSPWCRREQARADRDLR